MMKPTSRPRALDLTTHAVFREFERWLERYLPVEDDEAKRHLARAGVPLAKRRALHMRLLMEHDPRKAVAIAISAKNRAALPAGIRKHIEERIQGRGEFFACIACALNGQTYRFFSARIGRRTFVAFVPRNKKTRNMSDAKLKGVALGSFVALDEIVPVRPSRAGEKVAGTPQAVLSAAPGLPPRLDASGTLRCLMIRVRFSDDNEGTLPANLQEAEDAMNGVHSNLSAWSRGRLGLTWDITDVYPLPRTKDSYAFTTGAGDQTSLLHADARTAASPFWNSDQYDKVIVVFPDASSKRDPLTNAEILSPWFTRKDRKWLGLAQVADQGGQQTRQIWLQSNVQQDVIAHEIGHTLSLDHANRLNAGSAIVVNDGFSEEYADTFDTMGLSTPSPPGPRWFNPLYLYSIGWRDADEVILVDEPGDYTIRRFDHPQASGQQALVISREPAYYWIGNRGAFLNNTDLINGAYVVLVEPHRSRCSLLLDFTPSTSDIADAALDQGTVFSDITYGITLQVIAHGGIEENAYITVRVGFSEDPPVIVQQPASVTGVFGSATVQMHVEAGGTHPLHYQWLHGDNSPVAFGTDSPTLTFPTLLDAYAGIYRVVVSNDFGETQSADVTLIVVHEPPVLLHRSRYRNVTSELGTVTFNIDVQSSLPVTYSWSRETVDPLGQPSWVSTPVGGSTPSLTVGPMNVWGISRYICMASTSAGSVRVPFVLKVMPSYLTALIWGSAAGDPYDTYNIRDVAAVGAGNQYTVILKWDGTLVARGNGRSTADLASVNNVTAIAIGDFYCWALRADGSVWEWVGTRAPAPVAGLTGIIAISVFNDHRIALRDDGTIVEFGNAFGHYAPESLTNVVDISAGRDHGAALLNDGSVYIWGLTQTLHPPDATLTNAVGVACGDSHALVLKADGTVVGIGTNTAAHIPDILREGWGYSALELSGGGAHSLALRYHPVVSAPLDDLDSGGIQLVTTVEGWGDDSRGQATPPSWPSENVWGVAAGKTHSVLMMPVWRG